MEQINRTDGIYWYGKERCDDVECAYRRFREDYHRELEKAVYHRLDRIGQRKERIHGFGFVFDTDPERMDCGRVPCRILGLARIVYFRIVGGWDIPDGSDDDFDRWLDYAFSARYCREALVFDNRKDKAGRTSRRIRARYR